MLLLVLLVPSLGVPQAGVHCSTMFFNPVIPPEDSGEEGDEVVFAIALEVEAEEAVGVGLTPGAGTKDMPSTKKRCSFVRKRTPGCASRPKILIYITIQMNAKDKFTSTKAILKARIK